MNRIEISQGRPFKKIESVLFQAVILVFALFSFSGLIASETEIISTTISKEIIYINTDTISSGELKLGSTKVQSTIYVSPGAFIYGIHSISNARIVKAPSVSKVENKIVPASNIDVVDNSKSLIIVKKAGCDSKQKLPVISQERSKPYTSWQHLKNIGWVKIFSQNGVVYADSSFLNSEPLSFPTCLHQNISLLQIAKHEFYSPPLDLAINKVSASLLRGPPFIS